MNITSPLFSNYNIANTKNINNIKNSQISNLSFRGKDKDNKNEYPFNQYGNIVISPVFMLNMQLLKDGFTPEEISESNIFTETIIDDSFLDNPDLLEDVENGDITKGDIFQYKSKKLADIKAMQEAYSLLKENFITPDIINLVNEMQKIEEDLSMFLESKGKDFEKGNTTTKAKRMMLGVLHYINEGNIELLRGLLQDKNFNNVHLTNALIKIDKEKSSEYANMTLKMAQEIGYEKDFSLPLAILISEADENNIPIIEKILEEQDYLIENEKFVTEKLMSFLRYPDSEVAIAYLEDDTMTLHEVEECLDAEYDAGFEEF